MLQQYTVTSHIKPILLYFIKQSSDCSAFQYHTPGSPPPPLWARLFYQIVIHNSCFPNSRPTNLVRLRKLLFLRPSAASNRILTKQRRKWRVFFHTGKLGLGTSQFAVNNTVLYPYYLFTNINYGLLLAFQNNIKLYYSTSCQILEKFLWCRNRCWKEKFFVLITDTWLSSN
jgi:hypothetical protein